MVNPKMGEPIYRRKKKTAAMPLFLGLFECNVSRAGIIHIPDEWRNELGDNHLFAMRDVAGRNAVCLVVKYLYEKELVASQDENYPANQRAILQDAKPIRVDEHNRIKLPREIMDLMSGCRRVVLVGQIGTISVRPGNDLFLLESDELSGNALSALTKEFLK